MLSMNSSQFPTILGRRDRCRTQTGTDMAPSALVLKFRSIVRDRCDIATRLRDSELQGVRRARINGVRATVVDDAESRIGRICP